MQTVHENKLWLYFLMYNATVARQQERQHTATLPTDLLRCHNVH